MTSFISHFVNNFRRGLATNSSSSHSLVYMKEPNPNHNSTRRAHENEFGWNQFHLVTLREKLMYALVRKLEVEGYTRGWREPIPDIDDALEKFGHLFPELDIADFANASEGYIDHQSRGNPDMLIQEARDPHVEIWGGNDNDGDPHQDYLGYYADEAHSSMPAHIEKVVYLRD